MEAKTCKKCDAQILSPYYVYIDRKKVPYCPKCFEDYLRRDTREDEGIHEQRGVGHF